MECQGSNLKQQKIWMSDEEYKEAFSLFDKKGSGFIESSVVGNLLRALGKNPTQQQLHQLQSSLPTQVSYDHFVQKLVPLEFNTVGSVDDFIQGFHVFDKDGNGFISSGELRYVLTSLGEKLSDAEVDELLKCVEVDKNGLVNYEQFVRTILSA